VISGALGIYDIGFISQPKVAFQAIVTGSANSVYQKHAYMNVNPTPKISLANQAT
jgi:hypothetical protein